MFLFLNIFVPNVGRQNRHQIVIVKKCEEKNRCEVIMNKNIDSKNNRFSYGWIIVIASFILLIGSFGVQLCFGVFLKPLSEEFGWKRAATSGAMSVVMGISGLIGLIMGKLTDKYKVRIIFYGAHGRI